MSLRDRLRHSLVIERATEAGDENDRGRTAKTWATVASVNGSVQPRSSREIAQLNQAGAVVSSHRIFLEPTDVTPADRICDVDTSCSFAGDIFQLLGVIDPAGKGHHLEVDAQLVGAG